MRLHQILLYITLYTHASLSSSGKMAQVVVEECFLSSRTQQPIGQSRLPTCENRRKERLAHLYDEQLHAAVSPTGQLLLLPSSSRCMRCWIGGWLVQPYIHRIEFIESNASGIGGGQGRELRDDAGRYYGKVPQLLNLVRNRPHLQTFYSSLRLCHC